MATAAPPDPRPDDLRPRRAPLPWAVLLAYGAVFLLLDWASYIRPLQGMNITPWNPQPAVAVALLLASRRLWWVVYAGLLAAELLVRGLPEQPLVAALAAAALTGSYGVMATMLQHRLRGGWSIASARDVAWLLGVIALGALLSGGAYVGTLAAGGQMPPQASVGPALARYWVGDAVGMTVTLPILLALMDAPRRAQLLQTLRSGVWWLAAAGIVLLLGLLFWRRGGTFSYAYLMLLPVIGTSVRYGLSGAVLASALTQVGLIVAVQTGPHPDAFVVELQLLIAAITTTALLLGVTVEQRARADAELRGSLRLVAAGQMSAALAHELSQPLTALATYAQACEILAADQQLPPAQRQAQLLDVARRITADTRRAGDVVRRLRDFFQTGATTLRACDLAALVQQELAEQAHRAAAAGVTLQAELKQPLPELWVDDVQLRVVLRNLVANAVDAAAAQGSAGAVTVRASAETGEVLVEVLDSGAGVDAAQLQAVFEPGPSAKAGGMGVGLGLSRAIVEAHGGRLWALAGPGGHFCFTLARDTHAA